MKNKLLFFPNLLLIALIFISQAAFSQQVYTFTTCGATGRLGPTPAQINTAYASTNLNGNVISTLGIQSWVVPSTGFYNIKALGAQGGGAQGGLGASMEGDFLLTGGQTIFILVGQQGITESGQPNSIGGGGGSFVVASPGTNLSDILIIAGGGGASASTAYPNRHANSTNSGNNGHVDSGVSNPDGAGGTAGNGGNKSVSGCSLDRGAGGGGFLTSGGSICQTVGAANGGDSFVSGGNGGSHSGTGAQGGFGGGGAVWSTGFRGSGGGGGFSGGGAGQINSNSPNHAGGGGGSINNGLNQVNIAGTNSGDGEVIITQLSSASNDAGIQEIISPTDNCVGTYDITAVVGNFGKNQITSVQINWKINTTTQTPVSYTMLLDTFGGIGQSLDTITLGTIALTAGVTETIEVWTTLPNNVADTSNSNDSKTVTALGYAYPIINLGPNVFICPEDSATLVSGTGYDSLRWSTNDITPSITVNAQGQYNISVYSNGCESEDSVTVTHHPGAPQVDLGPDTTLCFGDSLVLDATIAGMTYEWQDMSTNSTFTVTTSGIYSVEIEDANGCNNDDAINITYYLEPNVTIYVAPSNDVCFGVPQTFTAFPLTQGSIDYQWKINGVNQGAQTTSPTFNGPADHGDSVSVDLITDICATNPYPVPSNKIGMTVNPKPKALTGKLLVKENTTETYVVPLTTGSAFVWRVSGGTISGDSTKNIVTIDWGAANPNATLTCQETDVKNCVRPNLYDVNVVSIVGVDNIAKGFGLGNAYPNPSNNMVNIPIHTDQNRDITLQLFDMSGKMVKTIFHGTITSDKNIQVSVDDLNNGLYIYKLTTADGYMSVKKLTVEH